MRDLKETANEIDKKVNEIYSWNEDQGIGGITDGIINIEKYLKRAIMTLNPGGILGNNPGRF